MNDASRAPLRREHYGPRPRGRQLARKKEKAVQQDGGAQDRLAERHPFVLIANHQLSEKHPAPKTPRSILTSRRVARVRNFTSVRGPMGFHCAPDERPQCSEYISRPASLWSILFVLSSAYLASNRVRVCARARTN